METVSKNNSGDRGQPAGLPSWPRWTLLEEGRSCVVSGRHSTPALARAAQISAYCSVLGLLLFPLWHCWGFQHIPDQIRVAINGIAAKLNHPLTFGQRKWIYVGLWLCLWLLRPWGESLFYFVYRTVLRKQTTVVFTAKEIIVARVGRSPLHYDRTAVAAITFLITPRPDLSRLLLKIRGKGADRLALFYQENRFLLMQYGLDMVLVARFAAPEDAQPFTAVCHYANDYLLKSDASAKVPLRPTPRTENINEPDI